MSVTKKRPNPEENERWLSKIGKLGLIQPLTRGAIAALDEYVDKKLMASRKSDDWHVIHSQSQVQLRAQREIVVRSGTPEPHLFLGMYHRAHNPQQTWLNSRDGIAGAWCRRSEKRFLGHDFLGDELYDRQGTTEMGRIDPWTWAMILPVSDRGEDSRVRTGWPRPIERPSQHHRPYGERRQDL